MFGSPIYLPHKQHFWPENLIKQFPFFRVHLSIESHTMGIKVMFLGILTHSDGPGILVSSSSVSSLRNRLKH